MKDRHCVDCGVDVYDICEYSYAVYSNIWRDAGFKYPFRGGDGLCCIECLETRLGRQLCNRDFDLSLPINNGGPFLIRAYFNNPQSTKLVTRLFTR